MNAVSHLRHDLRTPVNAVLGYSEMLLEDAPAHREAFESIITAGRAILALIDHRLPPTAVECDASELDSLRDAMRPHQQVILDVVAMLRQADASADAAMAADLDRIQTAATRLLTVGPQDHDAATMIVERPTMITTAARALMMPEPIAADAVAPFRILVVDDVADNRAVLARRLERDGHRVESAENGRDALEQIRQQSFDLILLDIMMPEVDGFEVLRQLKAAPETRDIPVIMISARDDLGSVVQCIEEGAEDHLPKPFEPVLLRARINASLDKKRLRDREREYLNEVKAIAAAASAVEEGQYAPASLARTAMRGDELGRLARVFDGMAAEVKAREDRLREQVSGLRQEIEAVRRRAVVTGAGDVRLPLGHLLAGRYEIEQLVGVGAMGTVYRAHDRELTETVAVKVLRPELLSDPTEVERFKAEVRLARRISHPSVVRTHDFGESDGVHYLTMEYVEGLTARALLDSRGRLAVASVLALAGQLAQALEAAHAQGVIHRDIKPQNMLLDADGTLKVMDFGVSRLSDSAGGVGEAGMLIGTPDYMAPEQLLGEDVDPRADLYATGVVLFECLAGQLPFRADTVLSKLAKVLGEAPPSLSALDEGIPQGVSTLITRLLARSRDDRPASARELLRMLDQL